jgi:hypothetical protein
MVYYNVPHYFWYCTVSWLPPFTARSNSPEQAGWAARGSEPAGWHHYDGA